jgi:tRNA(fMet)-specific endonuclease VapC
VRWLLDTDAVVHALRGKHRDTMRGRLQARSPEEFCVSAVTVAELLYGAACSREPESTRDLVQALLEPYDILAFDAEAAAHHARVRHTLRSQPIGERDLLIAAIALANDLVLVTSNAREFGRVSDLRWEDWTK